jgi:hypothetical protein
LYFKYVFIVCVKISDISWLQFFIGRWNWSTRRKPQTSNLIDALCHEFIHGTRRMKETSRKHRNYVNDHVALIDSWKCLTHFWLVL